MIAFFVRFIGLWLIAAALVAVVIDLTKSIAANSMVLTPLSQTWFAIDHLSLEAARQAVRTHVETYIGSWLWDPMILWVLALPTWVVIGFFGALLVFLGSRRQRRRRAAAM